MSKGKRRQQSPQKANRKQMRDARRFDVGQVSFDEEYPAHFERREVKPFAPLNQIQAQYACNIVSKDITFGVGPAGTGKTYVAASLAAEALDANEISTLIITRPMVACDEEYGFLPGDESEKFAPWVEPIMDVLEERLGVGKVKYLIKAGRIQAKPLMLMRGKTHKNTWVILEEAQNTTPNQMKMFLTRLGEGGKFIIDGDAKQSDLTDKRGISIVNGLEDALNKIGDVPQVGVTGFTREDIVRHGLVRTILDRYES